MKKILKPVLAIVLGLCLVGCSKKTYNNNSNNPTSTTRTKTKPTNETTTTITTTEEQKQYISLKLDFGDYGEYGVDEKYKGWHDVEEITKDLFPFDLVWELRNFKGWTYNDEIIFDENGDKVKDFEIAESMIFNVVFEPIEELKLFDYSLGMSDDQFNIWGFANDDPDYLSTLTTIEIPNKVTWNDKNFEIYRIHASGDKLNGCNNVEKLIIPYANGISSSGFLSFHFGCLWGTKEFENSYEIIGYFQPSSASSEYKETKYYVPKSLKTLKITGDFIDTHTFSNYNQLKDIDFIITRNMKKIYYNAFYGITEQITIYFEGTIAEFNSIDVAENGNDAWTNANVYFYSEEDPGDGGSYSYFYYDENGDIALW